jgi:hypothetical protein
MSQYVHELNVAQYRKLIAASALDPARDEVRHAMLLTLLAGELARTDRRRIVREDTDEVRRDDSRGPKAPLHRLDAQLRDCPWARKKSRDEQSKLIPRALAYQFDVATLDKKPPKGL